MPSVPVLPRARRPRCPSRGQNRGRSFGPRAEWSNAAVAELSALAGRPPPPHRLSPESAQVALDPSSDKYTRFYSHRLLPNVLSPALRRSVCSFSSILPLSHRHSSPV